MAIRLLLVSLIKSPGKPKQTSFSWQISSASIVELFFFENRRMFALRLSAIATKLPCL